MMGDTLAEELGTDRIPQADLEVLLQWRFEQASISPAEPRTLVYSTNEGEALRAAYDKHGRIVDLIQGPEWSQEHLESLKEEIDREAAVASTKIRRTWLFATVP